MGSPVLKRSVVIGGHKTSVSLEDEFWSGLKEIAAARNMTLSDLVATVERGRESGNLSSTLRLFVWTPIANGRRAAPTTGRTVPASRPPSRRRRADDQITTPKIPARTCAGGRRFCKKSCSNNN